MSPRRHLIRRGQDHLLQALGLEPADRRQVIDAMLRRRGADAVGYWLQLGLAMTIATLGLALGSTAVVIGAMLISPLMQPLVELGIGVAVGSPLLTFRAGMRTAGSVVVVTAGAAAITRALPFHEVTAELAARTSPTMLDLFVATACALAAVYTTVRGSRETVSAAAGTAIGIALVPPLCTAGYGLGIASEAMFRGALLLFTANFGAILAVTAVAALLLGFGGVDAGPTEDEVLASSDGRTFARTLARYARTLLNGRLGLLARIVFPLLLVGAIYVPLERALAQVSWEVRTRAAVDAVLASTRGNIVKQSVEVRGGGVSVRVFVLGHDSGAEQLRRDLVQRIAAATGREPLVEVVAVADAAALDTVAARLAEVRRPPPPPPPAPEPPAAVRFQEQLDRVMDTHWPADLVGAASRVRVTTAATPVVEVTHIGPSLGPVASRLVQDRLRDGLGLPVALVDLAIAPGPLDAPAADAVAWWAEVEPQLERIAGVEGAVACVDVLAPPPRARREDPTRTRVRASVVAASQHAGAVVRPDRERWRYQVVPTAEACVASP